MTFRPAPHRPRVPGVVRPRSAAALLASAGLLAGLAVAVTPAAAGAATPTSHNPKGALSGTVATSTGVTLRGWVVDPDAPTTNDTVFALVDGITRAAVTTSVPNASVTKKYHAGPTPGFVLAVPVPSGNHTVCLGANNLGGGLTVLLSCLGTPLGRTVSAGEKAMHSPAGVITKTSASTSSVRVKGFVTDPDFRNKHLVTVVYVDGQSAKTATTQPTTSGAPRGSGRYASFNVSVPVSTGTHQVCVWVVNIGWGSNSFLGCNAVDTRAGQPIAAGSPSPTILPKVLAEAKKHIGQPYVWGAVGPKKFDCSGLVVYSYKKNSFVPPRVSEDQSRAARLIPASKARPGDLVFFHDTQGDVYHVAIYVSPGLTVAAIDESEGVNYQRIWDPSSATYGSFTHT